MIRAVFTLLISLFFFSSCTLLKTTNKEEVPSGTYILKNSLDKNKVFVETVNEELHFYELPFTAMDEDLAKESLKADVLKLTYNPLYIRQKSLDLDFLTIPVKLRPAKKDIPSQLNSDITGALYVGYRIDSYSIKNGLNILSKPTQQINHIAYSIGVFSGFGNTTISPFTTAQIVEKEYEGIVFSNGIAAIIGTNHFSVGLTIGIDHLLDNNKSFWIYQQKPWVGVGVGLNLN